MAWAQAAEGCSLQPGSTSLRKKSSDKQHPFPSAGGTLITLLVQGLLPWSLSVNNFFFLCLHGFDKWLRFQLSVHRSMSCAEVPGGRGAAKTVGREARESTPLA